MVVGIDPNFYGFLNKKQPKTSLLSGFQCNIFVKEVVLALDVGPYFYGFLTEKQPKT